MVLATVAGTFRHTGTLPFHLPFIGHHYRRSPTVWTRRCIRFASATLPLYAVYFALGFLDY